MAKFKLIKKLKTGIRLGEIKTGHGKIKTPFFMPDATRGFVKQLSNSDLKRAGIGPMVVNTYHLFLQPKIDIIKKAGGIHKFMSWDKPLLSDSGGFQVFSLVHNKPGMGKITDKSVRFKSPIDGTWHELTPEKSIQIQFDLGTNMIVCLDDCPPNSFSRIELEKSVERTIQWARRCWIEYRKQVKKRKIKEKDRPLLFAVIQGGADMALRKYCAEKLIEIGSWDGYGFGAMPVDEKGNFLADVLKYTADLIPEDSLRFALGIGAPEDILKCAKMGWDMFDCVIPTREGRHGRLFSRKGKSKILKYETANIANYKFKKDFSSINKFSKLSELKGQTKAYLHHIFKAKDPLAMRLASLNNLEFYMKFMKNIRS